MTKINIISSCDTRIVTYPILKVLGIASKALLITENTSCRRLINEYELRGNIHNTVVNIVDSCENYELEVELGQQGYNLEEFEYIIYETINTIIKDCDKYIYVNGKDDVLTKNRVDSLVEQLDGIITITIGVGIQDKKGKNIEIGLSEIEFLYRTEDNKKVTVAKDKKLRALLVSIVNVCTGIDSDKANTILIREDC